MRAYAFHSGDIKYFVVTRATLYGVSQIRSESSEAAVIHLNPFDTQRGIKKFRPQNYHALIPH